MKFSTYRHFEPVARLMAEAGRTITEPGQNHPHLQVEIKEDNSPVTLIDKAAERFLTEGLLRIQPGSKVLGEESCPIGKGWDSPLIDDSGYVWVVDPIDGTKQFIEGSEYGIMVALRHDRETEAAWIYFPKDTSLLFASVTDGYAFHIENFGTRWQTMERLNPPPSMDARRVVLSHYPLEDRVFTTHGLDRIFAGEKEDKCIATDLRDMLLDGTIAVINQRVKTPWDFVPTAFIAEKSGAPWPRTLEDRPFRDRSDSIVFAPNRQIMNVIMAQTAPGKALG